MLVSFIYGVVLGWCMCCVWCVLVDCLVICVGNFIVGGVGKMLMVIVIVEVVMVFGYKFGLLSCGYFGFILKLIIVDLYYYCVVDVGDEFLLLVCVGLMVVVCNCLEGVKKLIVEGVDFIIMDDGF